MVLPLIALSLLVLCLGHSHTCTHDDLDRLGLSGPIIQPKFAPGHKRAEESAEQAAGGFAINWQPMRVYVDWTYESTFGDATFKSWIRNTLLPETLNFFQSAFKVHQNNGTL